MIQTAGHPGSAPSFLRTWGRDPGGILTAVLAVYAGLFLLWLVAPIGGASTRTLIGDLAFIPSGFAVAVLAWRTSLHRGLNDGTRRAWRLLAAAVTVWWIGDVIWVVYEVVLGEPPFPSPADAAYLLFYPLMMGGLLSFPHAPQSRIERTKFVMDAGTVLLGGWMVVWYFVLGPTAVAKDTPLLQTILSAAYPLGDLVLIFGIAAVLLRLPGEDKRVPFALLAGGVVAFLVADLAFGHLSLQDAYSSGDWPDGFWMVAALLFGAGAQVQYSWASREGPPEHSPIQEIQSVSPLPYAAVGLGYILLVVAGRGEPAYPLGGLLFGAIAVTAIVLARQLTLMNENIKLLGDLRALARTDPLTGVHTRRHFFELAGREFSRTERYDRPLSAIMIDVDHFKRVNDRFGHAAGDEVLRVVAARMLDDLRDIDLIGRYGGDEFIALLPESTAEAAAATAERLLARVAAASARTAAQPVSVTISAGVAGAGDCPDLATLVRRADEALYRAKAAGRNCVRRFSPER